ncbi:MAG: hypothetical protein ACLQPD_08500 [Desulfomonilaceae bacterium]
MADSKGLMPLILDKDMVVTDAPCAGATLIDQYTDGFFALVTTAGGTCVLGFEGEQPGSPVWNSPKIPKNNGPGRWTCSFQFQTVFGGIFLFAFSDIFFR